MKMLSLPSGKKIPAFGQGTWTMGENIARKKLEIESLQLGIDLGMTLIDTAEMYAEGGAESVVGEAIKDRRKEVYLVSKVYPYNATRKGVFEACNRSLKRMQTDYMDMYLLHWKGSVPLAETLDGFMSLKQEGKILDFGVSNFDAADMKKAFSTAGGNEIAANQVLYNLNNRGIEWDLLPWCQKHYIPVMAYSPIEQASKNKKGLLNDPVIKEIALQHHVAPAAVALAWLLGQEVVVIPKSGNPVHVKENSRALNLLLSKTDLELIDRAFPPPSKSTPLAVN
jgi:diketogulonate reductase-like aldo/keto reductase